MGVRDDPPARSIEALTQKGRNSQGSRGRGAKDTNHYWHRPAGDRSHSFAAMGGMFLRDVLLTPHAVAPDSRREDLVKFVFGRIASAQQFEKPFQLRTPSI